MPINTRLAAPEIEYWLSDSGSQVLFVDDTFAEVALAIAKRLPALRHLVYMGDGPAPDGMLDHEALIAGSGPAEDRVKGYDDLAAIYYTGGTTGVSKGVMLSHRNLVANALHSIPALGLSEGMRYLHAPPMFHIADGLTIFGVTMVAGRHIFIPGFEPVAVMKAIETHGVSHTLLVPTMVNMMVNHPALPQHDLSSLKHLFYGASPMPEAVIRRAIEVLPACEFTHAYGQTECAPVVDIEVEIVDADGRKVPPGTVGELRVRGPNVMLGYWNKPEETTAALRNGWMHSGDGAWMDARGYVYIVDRVKDMIV